MEIASEDAAVRLDDATVFAHFYAETLPAVYSYLFHRVGGSRAEAEDLTQETFMAAVGEIKRSARVGDPAAWVMGIAKHKLLDHYRRQEREERRLELVASNPRDDVVADVADVADERALECLGRIPAAQRAALCLRYLDDLSVPEVAHALGRSVHATESLLARGRQTFRRALEEANDG